jgi:peptidoglycan-associated lipoprotein
MKYPRIGIILVVFLVLTTHWTSAQSNQSEEEKEPVKKEVEKANDAYEAEQYNLAIELLKDAYSEVRGRQPKAEILFKTAECYRNINEYRDAERYYERAQKVGYNDNRVILLRGDMLKAQGEYEEAIEVYQEYKKEEPEASDADEAIEMARKAIEWKNTPSQYQVDVMEDINSESLDMSVTFGGDRRDNNTIVFVSSREESEGNKEDGWLGQSFMDLYISSAERKTRRRRRGGDDEEPLSYADMKWSTPVPLEEEGVVNTKVHEGTATFDSRKKELYFTKCIAEKNEKLGCAIYVTQEVGQSWKEPEQVIIGTDTTANVGHPALSADDKILYFVSNDYGTRGQHDIFMTTYNRREKRWAEPTNLGPIVNTEGREYYPVIHGDGYLYFSSDGHPGMGGLDVFRVKLGKDGMPTGDVENLKYPINTNYDDFHLVWKPGKDTEKGFVSSNRDGKGLDDNIYAVYRTPLIFNLEGVVTSTKTGAPIPQAEVTLDGAEGESYTVTADEDGYYIFDDTKLAVGNTYKLTFSKKKFLSGTGDASTVGHELASFEYVPSAKYFIKRLKLNKALDPIEEPIVLPNVFFDLAKAFIRPESKVALDSVVMILENNPTIVIELRSHTDYRDSEKRNNALSQRRADSSVAYLIKKGVNPKRLVAKGMGESEPFKIPENYDGYGAGKIPEGKVLTERYIRTLSPENQEVANQINRRTDFKVLRDDFVPEGGLDEPKAVDARDILEQKRNKEQEAGKIYTLKARESFGTVARKFKLNIRELKTLNGGLRGVRPFEGLQLKVETDGNYEEWDATHYQVPRRGMDWKDISKIVDVDDDDLEDLNPDIDKRDLLPGLWVRIKK